MSSENIHGYVDIVEIGRGASSIVYRAVQPEFGREVAIKVLTAAVTPGTWWRFERECRAVGALSGHPAIVTVYEAGRTGDGHPFIVMEHMKCGSLADRISNRGPLPWPEVIDIGIALAGALETAHHAGILHRDLKPANVLISAYGDCKLADFGIARIAGHDYTDDGSFSGTVAYAAPEELEGAPPSPAADLYSLCAVLFTLLSGRPPFENGDDSGVAQLILRITSGPPARLGEALAPASLAAVIENGLARAPAERPIDPAQLVRRLRAAVGAEDSVPKSPNGRGDSLMSDGDRVDPLAPTRSQLKPPSAAPTCRAGPELDSAPRRRTNRRTLAIVASAIVAVAGLVALGPLAFNRSEADGRTQVLAGRSVRALDQFDDAMSGWPRGNYEDLGRSDYVDGSYRMVVTSPGDVIHNDSEYRNSTDHSALGNLADTTVAVSALAEVGNPVYGLTCRQTGDRLTSRYYFAAVNDQGSYGIFVFDGRRALTLKSGQAAPVAANSAALSGSPTQEVATGHWRTLRLECTDNPGGRSVTLRLFADDVEAGRYVDTQHRIPSGAAGLVVQAGRAAQGRDPVGVSVLFDNFEVSGTGSARK